MIARYINWANICWLDAELAEPGSSVGTCDWNGIFDAGILCVKMSSGIMVSVGLTEYGGGLSLRMVLESIVDGMYEP